MKNRCMAIFFILILLLLPVTGYAKSEETDNFRMQSILRTDSGAYFVVKSDNSLWSWGYNGNGILGDGSTKDREKPKKVLEDVLYVREGSYHMVALKTNGEVWCWGSNVYATIGDGTMTDRLKPKKILTGVKEVTSSGNNYTVALKKNGEVWVWGNNSRGQLGNGSYKTESKPKMVLKGVSKISQGSNHVLALKENGEVWAWGYNDSGQVGNNSKKDVLKPIKIKSKMKDIIAEHNTSLAISEKGVLFLWGSEPIRTFSQGDTLTPKKYLTDVKSVTYDGYDILAIKSNGQLWSIDTYNGNIPYKVMDDVIYAYRNMLIDSDYQLYSMDKNNNLKTEKIMNNVAYVSSSWYEGLAVTFKGTLYKIDGDSVTFNKEKIMSKVRVYDNK